MAIANVGDNVKVHYKGTLDSGEVFDSSFEREPIEFKIGEGKVIKGFEDGVTGMEVDEKKEIHLNSEEAYGPYRNELVFAVDKKEFPEEIKLEVGETLQMQNENQQVILVTINEVLDNEVKLDANHPLAGKDLNFELQLVEIA